MAEMRERKRVRVRGGKDIEGESVSEREINKPSAALGKCSL